MENKMQQIYLEKVVLNIGIGSSEQQLGNAKALLKKLTEHEAAATYAKKRIPTLGVRPGQIIGALVTLRNEEAKSMLAKALDANDNTLKESQVRDNSVSFGIKEYIYLPKVKYDPKIGMLGMNVNANFVRKGKRVEERKRKRSRVSRLHKIVKRADIIEYLKKNFNANIAEE